MKVSDPNSEDALALALRVETVIRYIDGRLRKDIDAWRDVVDQWSHCVQRFGPGSMSACGALLGMVSIAWDANVRVGQSLNLQGKPIYFASIDDSTHSGETLLAALTRALEHAP